MNKPTQLFKGEVFLQSNLHLLVNRYTEDFIVPFHAHDFIEFCYVAEGKGFHHIENETISVSKGQLFAIPVGISHVFRPSSPDSKGDPLIVYNCLFDSHMVEQLTVILQDQPIREHLAELETSTLSYYSIFDRDGSIESLMQMLYREISVPRIGSTTMLHTLLSQLIVTVYRQKHTESGKTVTQFADFTQVIQYLERNLAETITLSELALMSKWSIRHLQRMFHRQTGQSFGSFLQNLRIQKSCELLRITEYKVSSIAEFVGYHDIDSFNSIFKKIVGKTPTEYRKIYKS